MKRLYGFLTALLFISTPFIASATVITWDYAGGILQPLKSARSAIVKGASFTATSTTANVFPYASSTALSATTLCLSTDCRTSWPSGSGTTVGTVSTSTTPTIGQLAYWTSTAYPSLLGTVATGTLSASSPLSFDNARAIIGGSATLSIANAAADGSTKGAAAFTASDFDAVSGVISLDYTNGQKASGSQPGFLSSTDWTTFNSKQAALTFTAPIFNSANTISWYGLATTSQPSSSNLLVSNGSNGVYGVSTSTLSATSPLTGSFVQVGSGGSLGCQTASGAQAGCLSSADWTTFNGKQATISATSPIQFSSNTLTFTGLSTTTAITGGQVLYASNSTKGVSSVATSTLAVGSSLSVASGAFGYQVGGSNVTFGLNLGNANSWSALQTFTAASTTHLTAGTSFQIPNAASIASTVAGYFGLDTTNNQLKAGTGSSQAVFDQRRFLTFGYSTTTWSGTTTIPLGFTPAGMTLDTIQCSTDVGTVEVRFYYGPTPTNQYIQASTTPGVTTWTSNNTPGAAASTTVQFGNPASSPTQVSCTISGSVTGT